MKTAFSIGVSALLLFVLVLSAVAVATSSSTLMIIIYLVMVGLVAFFTTLGVRWAVDAYARWRW